MFHLETNIKSENASELPNRALACNKFQTKFFLFFLIFQHREIKTNMNFSSLFH